MKSAPAKSPTLHPAKKKRNNQTTPLNAEEDARLKDLVVRYQSLVVGRNQKHGEKENANCDEAHVMRAGLLALEEFINDDDFRKLILRSRDR